MPSVGLGARERLAVGWVANGRESQDLCSHVGQSTRQI